MTIPMPSSSSSSLTSSTSLSSWSSSSASWFLFSWWCCSSRTFMERTVTLWTMTTTLDWLHCPLTCASFPAECRLKRTPNTAAVRMAKLWPKGNIPTLNALHLPLRRKWLPKLQRPHHLENTLLSAAERITTWSRARILMFSPRIRTAPLSEGKCLPYWAVSRIQKAPHLSLVPDLKSICIESPCFDQIDSNLILLCELTIHRYAEHPVRAQLDPSPDIAIHTVLRWIVCPISVSVIWRGRKQWAGSPYRCMPKWRSAYAAMPSLALQCTRTGECERIYPYDL